MSNENEILTIKGWVARDKNGELFAYTKVPTRGDLAWLNEGTYFPIPLNHFPNLRWEDNPMEAEMTIKQATRHD